MQAIGLDLSSNKISVVELVKTRRGLFIRNAGIDEIEAHSIAGGEVQDPVVLSTGLKNIWKKFKISGVKVYVGISNQKVIVKEIQIPVTEEKEIDNSIKYQINDFMPVPKNNIIYDYYVMEKGDGFSKIMLVGAVKDMISNVVDALKNARLVPLAIDLNCFALYRIVDYVYGFGEIKKKKDSLSYCVVHLGLEISIVEIIKDGTLKYPRFIAISIKTFIDNLSKKLKKNADYCEKLVKNFDFSSLLEDEHKENSTKKTEGKEGDSEDYKIRLVMKDNAEQLINEVKRSIDRFLQDSSNYAVDKIILGGEKLINIEKYIENNIKYKVELLNISDFFSLDYLIKNPMFKDRDLRHLVNELGLGIGMALRGLST